MCSEHDDTGSSLWSILELLRGMQNEFPQVDVKFDIDSPATPIIIHVRPHLDLLFSEHQQRLHTIVLKRFREAPPVTIRFKDRVLLAPDQVLRRVDVSRTVGPTYEGEELRYPGVWFSFDEHAASQDQNQEIKSITVTQHNGQDRDGLQEVIECPVMCGDIAKALVKVRKGILLHFYPTATSEPTLVEIGITTAQDLSVELGAPSRIHYREDDRMHIHSRQKTNDEEEDDSSCMGPAFLWASYSPYISRRLLQLFPLRNRFPDIRYHSYGSQDHPPYQHCKFRHRQYDLCIERSYNGAA